MEYQETKTFAQELQEIKKDIELYLFHRRYQRMAEGKFSWEDRLWTFFTKTYVRAIVHWRQIAKRSIDIAVAIIGLIVSFPLAVLIMAAIKLDSPGPIFLRQSRVGFKGKTFSMIKFRSMRHDAEVHTGPVWAKESDPRVTRVGNFIRKTHLDEIPQLLNVLKGEMSLVGPRPERPHFVHEFRQVIPHYDRRLCVKPGITGLAQVRQGYDETLEDVKRKLKYDTLYIRNMCPLLDLKVLSMTLIAVALGTK